MRSVRARAKCRIPMFNENDWDDLDKPDCLGTHAYRVFDKENGLDYGIYEDRNSYDRGYWGLFRKSKIRKLDMDWDTTWKSER